MSRLTTLEALPLSPARSCAPHQFRKLGDKVLIASERGDWQILSAAQYARYAKGLSRRDPLRAHLRAGGFMADDFDGDAAARASLERGLAGWDGPSRHVLVLEGPRAGAMTPDTARAVADFIFRCPGETLSLEAVSGRTEAAWPALWFLAQYVPRRAQWSRRPVELSARASALTPGQCEFLRERGVALRAQLSIRSRTARGARLPFAAPAAVATVKARGADGGDWARWFRKAGVEEALLLPAGASEGDVGAFLAFYRDFFAAASAAGEPPGPRDGWTREFLAARAGRAPGLDVLEQLGYDHRGRVYTSERAIGLEALLLGDVSTLSFADVGRSPAARAVIVAGQPDNQPQCSQCVYRAVCAVPAACALKRQGSIWGRLPDSAECAWRMGVLDAVFSNLADEGPRAPALI